jgi:hypothetical protein
VFKDPGGRHFVHASKRSHSHPLAT